MKLDTYQQSFQQSAAWRLLRARSAPVILAFLSHIFKEADQQTLPWYEVEIALVDFLTYSQTQIDGNETTDPPNRQEAGRQLNRWVKEGWLRKFPDEQGQDLLELTAQTEKALTFAQSLERQEFVGTESRFKDIFRRLQEMVEGSREDPEEKIRELEEKIKGLQAEIKQIRQTGEVAVLSDTQLKERAYGLSKSTRELLGDFKEVAQNFKNITRAIYKKQADQTAVKGELLGFALDQIDALRESEQGKSFYAFWEFLISSRRQQELGVWIKELLKLLEERGIPVSDPLLAGMKRQLYVSGQSIFSSNQLLAEKLNRIVSTRNIKEQKRALQLIDEIRKEAMEGGEALHSRHFWEVEEGVEVQLPLDRPPGEPPAPPMKTRPPEPETNLLEEAGLGEIFGQFYIDRRRLESNIRQMLRGRAQLSLSELLEAHPLQQGLSELLTYYAIASESRAHRIREAQPIELALDAQSQRHIQSPEIIFTHE